MIFKPKILLIYCGGTIGMIQDFETKALKTFYFNNILEKIPELSQLNCLLETISLDNPIDSSNVNSKVWSKISKLIENKYKQYDGFVILHGTDTMSYTASALSFMLENLSKPVIFTGSQLPIGHSRTDAKENLITAIEIACLRTNDKSILSEVCLYFEYKLYRGNRTTKINAENFNAFISPNYPVLVESGVNLKIFPEHFLPKSNHEEFFIQDQFNTNVIIIKIFQSLNETILTSIFNIPSLQGIVLETYGIGNAFNDQWFLDLIKKTISKGIQIVNVTQCVMGSVNMGKYETSTFLKEIGVISGKDITAEAALTKLMYLLGKNIPKNEFQRIFETPSRGEMS